MNEQNYEKAYDPIAARERRAALEKQLKKLREPWEYEVVVNQIFTLPLVEND